MFNAAAPIPSHAYHPCNLQRNTRPDKQGITEETICRSFSVTPHSLRAFAATLFSLRRDIHPMLIDQGQIPGGESAYPAGEPPGYRRNVKYGSLSSLFSLLSSTSVSLSLYLSIYLSVCLLLSVPDALSGMHPLRKVTGMGPGDGNDPAGISVAIEAERCGMEGWYCDDTRIDIFLRLGTLDRAGSRPGTK